MRSGGRKKAEQSARRKVTRPQPSRGNSFLWIQRAGGRFYAHEEEIKAGEYSDDTQLIIATGRSLLESDDWYQVLTEVELPLWTAHERGGGGATKRAAASWLSGKPPWTTPAADQRRYFEAGGNGVIMRILPHCVWGQNPTTSKALQTQYSGMESSPMAARELSLVRWPMVSPCGISYGHQGLSGTEHFWTSCWT